jgi:hypothetical protein
MVERAVSRPPQSNSAAPMARGSPGRVIPVRGRLGLGWLRKVTVEAAAVMVPSVGVRLTGIQPVVSGSLRVQATLP